MVYPLLPLFLVGILGSSKTQLGVMEGGAVLIVAMLSAFAGFRSDHMRQRHGRVPWIRWGYGLPVLGKTVIALATAWPLILSGRLLDRFGKGLRGAPRDAMIADAVTAELRGRAFGIHRAFDTAGALVGVLISAFLLWWLTGTPLKSTEVESLGVVVQSPPWVYRAIFGVGAILGLVSLALTFLVTEAEPRGGTGDQASPDAADAITEVSVQAAPTAWLKMPASYWAVLTALVLFSLANSSDTFLLLRASDLGYSPWTVVLMYALYNLTYSALSYPAGLVSDKIGRWRVIAVGWTIYAIAYVGFALLPASFAWGMWPLMSVYGLYMAITDGVGKALITDHAPPQHRGAAMGLFYAITGLTTLVASLLVGVAWDAYGARPALLISASLAVFALMALPLIRRTVDRPR